MIDLVIGPIPCPLKPRANKHLGEGRSKAHWSGEGSLAAEQRARVRAAFQCQCAVCGATATAARLPGRTWKWAIPVSACDHKALRRRQRLPLSGPDYPLDVLMIRVPSHGGRTLDDDGLQMALKAIRDQIAEELWPRDARGKLIGTVDDSEDWLRWLYGERPHRKPRKRPRPGDPSPDPSNVGTELLEIVIAPRCVCRCFCGELREAAREWARGGRTARSAGEAAREDKLLRAIERIRDKPCGCGDVPPLKQRWLGAAERDKG